MNTMLFFNVGSEKEAMQIVYNFFHLSLLTNPECSFVSNTAGLNARDTYGSTQKQIPKTCDEFCSVVRRKSWDACLCVAGTDKSDSRRVVVSYMKDLKQFVVNFPSATTGYSHNELNIKTWLESALKVS